MEPQLFQTYKFLKYDLTPTNRIKSNGARILGKSRELSAKKAKSPGAISLPLIGFYTLWTVLGPFLGETILVKPT